MYDCLVIGGGVAGVAAALTERARGARVALVRAGPGASALASGGWIGPLAPALGAALAAAGLPHAAAAAPLLHPSGERRGYDFAAATHLAAAGLDDALVCGIAGLGSFRAAALARLWGCGAGDTIMLPGTPAAGWSPVALAGALDRDPAPLLAALAPRARAGAPLVLPAVLGLAGAGLGARLQEQLGVPVVEALGVPPSVPGWRLATALLRCLERAGVTLNTARVQGCIADGDVLRAVRVRNEGGEQEVAAERFVLATGRYTGGGIAVPLGAAPVFREEALGCEVHALHLGQTFTAAHALALTLPLRTAPQPVLEVGVVVDAERRPRTASGDVRYRNLTALGAVVAGTPPGLGHAVAAIAQEEA